METMMEIEDYRFEVKTEPETVLAVVDQSFPEKYHDIYGAYKEKDYETCINHINQVKEYHIEYEILKAACLIHAGKKVSEAHKILDEVLENDPDNAYTLYAKGLAYFHEDKWEDSILYFEKALELDSGDMERAEVMIIKAQEKIRESQSSSRHRTSVNVKRSTHRASRVARRFGCEKCNHFFGKKYNLDRHNQSLHNRETPEDFPRAPKNQTKSIAKRKVKAKRIAKPKTVKVKKEPVETKVVSTKRKLVSDEESFDGSMSSEKSTKSEPSRPNEVALKKGRVKCPVCKKQFKKTSIARHVIIHSGNKPHKCSECTKAFFQKSDLTRHIATHSDELQFECNQCDRKFRIKKNLQVHKRRHHSA